MYKKDGKVVYHKNTKKFLIFKQAIEKAGLLELKIEADYITYCTENTINKLIAFYTNSLIHLEKIARYLPKGRYGVGYDLDIYITTKNLFTGYVTTPIKNFPRYYLKIKVVGGFIESYQVLFRESNKVFIEHLMKTKTQKFTHIAMIDIEMTLQSILPTSDNL